ncbi:MAG: hypothetical protein FD177_1885 [Desulfovibrionaceae bacterium]|nr:MAG: hypothetical protein FD177_1885 [Desulfovibrionaceae bacterium]
MSGPESAIEPDMIPYGMKAALLCLEDGPWRAGAAAFFKDLGYYLMDEPDPARAAAKLRLNAVDAVVLGETMRDPLAEMHARPGLRRREAALFLVGAAPSLDAWAAFVSGADWTLAEADAPRCAELLAEALKRQDGMREPWRLAEAARGA